MKRTVLALLLVCSMLLGLCVIASASDFDAAAQDLQQIGMFRGTGSGFNLDQEPTRAEAAVMLTRLYGAEETAAALYESGELSNPFTDVPAYAAPSVAWLYAQGLTKGMSETVFGAGRACCLKDYCVFLLRALGYQDGVDFSYANALPFAAEKGFYNPAVYSGAFLRDDLVGLTYDALCTDVKDGSTYLLKKLVDDGSIDKAAAKELLEKAEAYRAIAKASDSFDSTAIDTDYTLDLTMTTSSAGQDSSVRIRSTGNVKFIAETFEMDYDMKLSAEGDSTQIRMWMKDGVYYISQDGENYKLDLSQMPEMQQLQTLMAELPSQTVSSGMSGLAYLSDIQTQRLGSCTVYIVKIPAKTVEALMQSAMEQTGTQEMAALLSGMDVAFTKDLTLRYTVSGETLTKIGVELGMQYNDIALLSVGNGTEDSLPYAVQMDLSMDMTIRATGSDVKISYPDFSGFVSMDADTVAR